MKRSTFPFFNVFTMRSLCVHLLSPLRSRSPFTKHSTQSGFTKCSPCAHLSFSVYISFSQYKYFNNTFMSCSLFVIFSWLQMKQNVRITQEALRINHSSCFHMPFTNCRHAVTVQFVLAFALCVRSLFISTHQIPLSVCSPFPQSALTIHSAFKWESRTF